MPESPIRFNFLTRDFSCLGFALMLQDDGHQVIIGYGNEQEKDWEKEKRVSFNLVGENLVDCYPIEKVIGDRNSYRDAYWIFDNNHQFEQADLLRKEGFHVWGASELTHKMEHDREFGVQIAQKAGLDIPDTQEFTSIDEAIAFLEQNEDKAYVCKPDDTESHLTYVPQSETAQSANKELRAYLKSVDENKDFILQEKIKGLEVNVECFFSNGKPYFAWVDLECKRKNSGDKGELTGCSQNISFVVDLKCELVRRTIGRMFDFYKGKAYTGFGDINCILSDNKVYFIEWTVRFGFNAHPTLFKTLLIDDFGDTLATMIYPASDPDFYNRWRKGFGAGLQVYLDHPVEGFPIHIDKEVAKDFYPYDIYQSGAEEDQKQDFTLAGFGNEVGVMTGFGYTINDAAKDVLENALKVNFPSCAYREDLTDTDYPSSPQKRYEALQAMQLL